jgi:hypothetical protein
MLPSLGFIPPITQLARMILPVLRPSRLSLAASRTSLVTFSFLSAAL